VRIHDVRANKRFELKRQPLETVISEIRVAGPPDAAATFLSETTLRTGEDVALLAVWSERDQALTSAPYRTGPMQIIATGGLDDAVRALRKGAALKAVKALLALAAGIGIIVVLITQRDVIGSFTGVAQQRTRDLPSSCELARERAPRARCVSRRRRWAAEADRPLLQQIGPSSSRRAAMRRPSTVRHRSGTVAGRQGGFSR
jgi:hypothetical protein